MKQKQYTPYKTVNIRPNDYETLLKLVELLRTECSTVKMGPLLGKIIEEKYYTIYKNKQVDGNAS